MPNDTLLTIWCPVLVGTGSSRIGVRMPTTGDETTGKVFFPGLMLTDH